MWKGARSIPSALSFALTHKSPEPSEELVVEGFRVRMDCEWLTLKAKVLMEDFPQSVIAVSRWTPMKDSL